MANPHIPEIIAILRTATRGMTPLASTSIKAVYGKDPFLLLIGCILSLRTKDSVSLPASLRLFEHARTPQALLVLPVSQIEKLIYPVGFYSNKSRGLHVLCAQLLERHHGIVPNTREALMALYGVGLKTANLVLSEGFDIPALCVDTHVHGISNRLGVVQTKTPEETECALRAVLPQEFWNEYSRLLVLWGQNICVPLSPKCSVCPIRKFCPRIGVVRSR